MTASQRIVLHVEDEPDDRLITANSFKRAAPQILLRSVVDGQEAISYLSGAGPYSDRTLYPMPHVVMLDLKLPRKSGLEVVGWIRRQVSLTRLPVVMLTSSSLPADVQRAYAAGASSYLVKVVELGALRSLVRGIGELAALAAALPGQPTPEGPKASA